MKSIIVTLMTLALVMGSAKAGPMMQEEESFKDHVQTVMMMIVNYFQSDNEPFPVRQLLEMIVGKLPCLDLKPCMLAEYTRMICGEENCEKDAPDCMDALMPTEICAINKLCLPKSVEAALFMGKSLKMEMQDCVMEQMIISRGLAYQEDAYEQNVQAFLSTIMVEKEVKNDIMAAAGGKCTLPPRDGSSISDMIRFKICLMNTCVNSKRLLPNSV